MLNDKHIRVCHHKYTYYPRIAKQTLKSNCLCTHWRPRTVSEILGHLLLVRDCTLHLANVLNQHTSNAYCALLIFLRHLCGTGRLVREVRIYIHRMQHKSCAFSLIAWWCTSTRLCIFVLLHTLHTHTHHAIVYTASNLTAAGKKWSAKMIMRKPDAHHPEWRNTHTHTHYDAHLSMLTGVRLSGDLRVKKGVESEGYAVWMCQVKDCTVIGIWTAR